MGWDDYLEQTKGLGPNDLLQEALTYVKIYQSALDLGGGNLRDASLLIKKGFHVTVIDSNPTVSALSKQFPEQFLEVFIERFDEHIFPARTYDLVNAQYSLPFTPPVTFKDLWIDIVQSMRPNAIFTGQFFGNEDGWSEKDDMTFHEQKDVEGLFERFKIIKFQEEKGIRPTASGKQKHWHVFHLIARLRDVT